MKAGLFQLTSETVIKVRDVAAARCEVEALRFAAKHTSIPVPRLIDYWEEGEEGYIIMKFIPGSTLARTWKQLSEGQRSHVMRTIAGFVDQLQSLPQPALLPQSNLPRVGWIGSTSGNGFFDYKIGSLEISPFPDERSFRDWHVSLFRSFGRTHAPTAKRLEEIRTSKPVEHPVVFTHGDISRRNVMVRKVGEGDEVVEVAALLDWEQAGWRPIYWEGMKWEYMSDSRPEWYEYARKVVYRGYEEAVDLDNELLDVSGWPMYHGTAS